LAKHYYDWRGVARVYQMTLAAGTWQLWRDEPGFCQRFTGVLSDDETRIDGAWQTSADGVDWEAQLRPDLLQDRTGRG
jgi:hypothetical protein